MRNRRFQGAAPERSLNLARTGGSGNCNKKKSKKNVPYGTKGARESSKRDGPVCLALQMARD